MDTTGQLNNKNLKYREPQANGGERKDQNDSHMPDQESDHFGRKWGRLEEEVGKGVTEFIDHFIPFYGWKKY